MLSARISIKYVSLFDSQSFSKSKSLPSPKFTKMKFKPYQSFDFASSQTDEKPT